MSHRHTPTNRKSSFRKQLLNAAEQYFHPLVFLYYKVQSVVRPVVDDLKLRYWVYRIANKWDSYIYRALTTYPWMSSKRTMLYSLVKREVDIRRSELQPNAVPLSAVVSTAKQLVSLIDLVGVQPLTGPVGLVYQMVYTSETGDIPVGMDSCKGIKLSIVSKAVEAKSRKLQAAWSMELSSDLSALHGMNVQDEIANILGAELSTELIAEVISDLIAAAEHSFDYTITTQEPTDWRNIGNQTGFMINRVSSRIAQSTRRGAGNWAIVSPDMLTYIQSSQMFEGVDQAVISNDTCEFFTLAGTSNGIKIYVSSYVPSNKILVGYKGVSETDAGYIYSPYRVAYSGGPVLDAASFQPMLSVGTRYATSSGALAPFTNGNYYGIITVNQMLTENTTNVESGNRT